VSWLDPHKSRKITVVGEKMMVVFDDMESERKITVYDKGATTTRTKFETYGDSSPALRRHPSPDQQRRAPAPETRTSSTASAKTGSRAATGATRSTSSACSRRWSAACARAAGR
jgi:hypothetical protein